MSTTLIIGASENPQRYAYIAAERLLRHGHEIALVGQKAGKVFGKEIQTGTPKIENLDTVTLYVGSKTNISLLPYLLELKPRRVIFNPGTENYELAKQLQVEGIEVEEACTLVLLASNQY